MTLVSAGMPVLNGAAAIEPALRSLQAQTHRDLEIVVCDNASDDATAEIVRRLAQDDPRILLRCFAERVDIRASFQRAFKATRGDFFFFAPADDRWDPRFVEATLAMLQRVPDLAAACSRVAFAAVPARDGVAGKAAYLSFGTKELRGDHLQNLLGYLADPFENARAFGLYRRAALEGAFPERWYPGWDWQMTARTLAKGGQGELEEVLLWREATPPARYAVEFRRLRRSPLARLLPHWPVARAIWRDPTTPRCRQVAWNLALLALRSHLNFAPVGCPRYGRFLHWLAERVKFRRWAINRGPVLPPGEMPREDWRQRLRTSS
jgi:glycosyltransferase involved in cell wall biosynthesis